MVRNDHDLIEILFRHWSGWTEENHGGLQASRCSSAEWNLTASKAEVQSSVPFLHNKSTVCSIYSRQGSKSNNKRITVRLFFPLVQQPNTGQDCLIARFLDHDTSRSVRLLCMRNQPVADLYLTKYNTHKRQTSMPQAGFEPATPTSDRPQTLAARPPGLAVTPHWY